MNEQHAYEKHLADQLQSLPPAGNAKQNWPLMKSILDREMPESDRRPGGGRWWLFGSILAIIIVTGLLVVNYTDKADSSENARNTASVEKGGAAVQPKTQNGNADDQLKATPAAASPVAGNSPAQPENKKADPVTGAEQPADPNANPATSHPVAESNNKAATPENKLTLSEDKAVKSKPENRNGNISRGPVVKPVSTKEENLSKASPGNSSSVVRTNTDRSAGTSGKTVRKAVSPARKVNSPIGKNRQEQKTGSSEVINQPDDQAEEDNTLVASDRAYSDHSDNSASVNTGLLVRDSIRRNYPAIAVTTERSRFRVKTDRVKNLKNRVVGTGENKNFVIGLTFPLAFPLSDQRVLAYNFNARANTLSDYLPAPNFQYHFSQKSYLQAELQFASPQYIEPALLSVKHYELGPGNYYRFVTSSVFARKLYYFNLPLELHYSPFKNFYLGSGLQFSSLMSGVGYSEEKGASAMGPNARDSVIRQSYFKFKNDTLSGRLNGNEVRVLLDANYYWKKFTVGFRYNQAVNSYINLQVNNNLPPYSERNKTLQFYLRYNIWENRRK